MCLRSIGRVRQLVEDHFLCERLDAGGLSLRLEAVRTSEIAETLRERAAREPGELTLDFPDELAVRADRLLLDRAMDALVGAASRDGAAVRVAVNGDEAAVTFVVIGAPPLPDALHDPVKGAPSDPRGRALGLPVARRVAAALGGVLTASPEGYTLSLPRAGEYAARPSPPANP
jgi:K+-sensing histidine kinase KdpD